MSQKLHCYEGTPEENAGKLFKNIDLSELECPGPHPEAVTHSLLTILIVLLMSMMFVLLYFNRQRVQSNVKPLIDNFQRSMQYKTIEKVNGTSSDLSYKDYSVVITMLRLKL